MNKTKVKSFNSKVVNAGEIGTNRVECLIISFLIEVHFDTGSDVFSVYVFNIIGNPGMDLHNEY